MPSASFWRWSFPSLRDRLILTGIALVQSPVATELTLRGVTALRSGIESWLEESTCVSFDVGRVAAHFEVSESFLEYLFRGSLPTMCGKSRLFSLQMYSISSSFA